MCSEGTLKQVELDAFYMPLRETPEFEFNLDNSCSFRNKAKVWTELFARHSNSSNHY